MSIEQSVGRRTTRLVFKGAGLRVSYDLWALSILALLLPLLVELPWPWLRIPLGLFLVLIAPGYVLQAALFARRDALDVHARIALSFGLSVAVLPVFALALDRLPWGIYLWPMTWMMIGWLLVWSGIALVQRVVLQDKAVLPPPVAPRSWWQQQSGLQKLGHVSASIAVVTVVFYAVFAFADAREPLSTEFYVLGTEGRAENYPSEVAPGTPMQLQLGIVNREGHAVEYRVEVRSGGSVLNTVGPITIAEGATWQAPVRYAITTPGDDQLVDMLLFRAADTQPYRQLQLWVNVQEFGR